MKHIKTFSSSQKIKTLFYPSQVTYIPPSCLPVRSDPACTLVRIWWSWAWGCARLVTNRTLGHTWPLPDSYNWFTGKTRGGKCKTFPIWSSHPLRKPVGGRPSSLHKETAFCPLIPNGPLKGCSRCLLFLRVFSPSTETSSSGRPSKWCCFCSCLLYFSSREPTLFQEQDPRTKGMQMMHVT